MYYCKECTAPVEFIDGRYIRSCEHTKSIILMDMGKSHLRGTGAVNEQSLFKQLHKFGLAILSKLHASRKL